MERFQRYFRLDCAQFDELLTRVGPRITRLDTTFFQIYLATGDSYRLIAYSYRVGITTVDYIIPEVATAIWECLVSEFMPVPKKEDWMTIAEEFRQHWNFPNCLGSIDGKHVVIQAPSKSGSLFFNYKGTYSIVLLAVVDARYRFRVVDVGAYGRRSDGGTLASSKFGKALQNGRLDLPEDRLLPEAEHLGCQPHVFVADEAFPLQTPHAPIPWVQPLQKELGLQLPTLPRQDDRREHLRHPVSTMEDVPASDWDQPWKCGEVCEGNLCVAQLHALDRGGPSSCQCVGDTGS
ncbi:hypothetical protein AAFF_G00025150 [Aldrovandia affinis]|uniref:DDE Tnp4 domain-containing protein n=1 Tax=Aldrovandia affinis TaxID=143900 RepID=A0AAD7T5Y1_9TELE|nr:hypothetical protein AAFF_G00025150 [Aldrovandia affinis]